MKIAVAILQRITVPLSELCEVGGHCPSSCLSGPELDCNATSLRWFEECSELEVQLKDIIKEAKRDNVLLLRFDTFRTVVLQFLSAAVRWRPSQHSEDTARFQAVLGRICELVKHAIAGGKDASDTIVDRLGFGDALLRLDILHCLSAQAAQLCTTLTAPSGPTHGDNTASRSAQPQHHPQSQLPHLEPPPRCDRAPACLDLRLTLSPGDLLLHMGYLLAALLKLAEDAAALSGVVSPAAGVAQGAPPAPPAEQLRARQLARCYLMRLAAALRDSHALGNHARAAVLTALDLSPVGAASPSQHPTLGEGSTPAVHQRPGLTAEDSSAAAAERISIALSNADTVLALTDPLHVGFALPPAFYAALRQALHSPAVQHMSLTLGLLTVHLADGDGLYGLPLPYMAAPLDSVRYTVLLSIRGWQGRALRTVCPHSTRLLRHVLTHGSGGGGVGGGGDAGEWLLQHLDVRARVELLLRLGRLAVASRAEYQGVWAGGAAAAAAGSGRQFRAAKRGSGAAADNCAYVLPLDDLGPYVMDVMCAAHRLLPYDSTGQAQLDGGAVGRTGEASRGGGAVADGVEALWREAGVGRAGRAAVQTEWYRLVAHAARGCLRPPPDGMVACLASWLKLNGLPELPLGRLLACALGDSKGQVGAVGEAHCLTAVAGCTGVCRGTGTWKFHEE